MHFTPVIASSSLRCIVVNCVAMLAVPTALKVTAVQMPQVVLMVGVALAILIASIVMAGPKFMATLIVLVALEIVAWVATKWLS